MGDNVIELNCVTKLDLPVSRIIKDAAKQNLDEIVIVGFDKNGDFYFASNKADGGSVLWLLELAKKKLLEIGDA